MPSISKTAPFVFIGTYTEREGRRPVELAHFLSILLLARSICSTPTPQEVRIPGQYAVGIVAYDFDNNQVATFEFINYRR